MEAITREEVIKHCNETQKGICKECGTKMKHYRKLDDSFWVHYELCGCGRMTNFTREHVNHAEQMAAFKDHMRRVWGWKW